MPEQNTEKKEVKEEVKEETREEKTEVQDSGALDKVLKRVGEAENVLVALSDSPSVDEMAAAIGLTMALDSIGKHATAIYSGKTPNVLEFLDPQKTFETNTNSLQDFIIALNKEKADHLRYKVDGDFVKVYITPYRTTISENDLEFSRGDFNVDLVISLNVAAATDLDGALKEHGRIMHDASAVNITNHEPGKFGEIEWSEPGASSISEMVTKLSFKLDVNMDKGIATAFLTGLVAATDRFSNEMTTPEVMVLAGKLMEAGADQQLVAANVSGEFRGVRKIEGTGAGQDEKEVEDASTLRIEREEKSAEVPDVSGSMEAISTEVTAETGADLGIDGNVAVPTVDSGSDGSAVANESVTVPVGEVGAGVAVESNIGENVAVASTEVGAEQSLDGVNAVSGAPAIPEIPVVAAEPMAPTTDNLADQMVRDLTGQGNTDQKDYGKMIDEALAEPLPGEVVEQPVVPQGAEPTQILGMENPAAGVAPGVDSEPAVNNIPAMDFGGGTTAEGGESYLVNQPEKVLDPSNAQIGPDLSDAIAKSLSEPSTGGSSIQFETPGMSGASGAAQVDTPAMEPVPVPSGLPMPGEEILPPPPTPPVDFSMDTAQPEASPVPEMPEVQIEVPEVQGATQTEQQSQVPDNNSFQIPGM